MEAFAEYGYIGLFIASFLSATIVPFSSEAVLGLMIASGFNPLYCLLIASVGNWLGGLTSYAIGWAGRAEKIEKWLKIDEAKIRKFEPYVNRWGSLLALMCWAPIVGDVFAVVLGFAHTNPFRVALFMFIGKALRYLVIAFFMLKMMSL